MDVLALRPGEPYVALAARVLARALDEAVDIRDVSARLWERPDEATPVDVQILGAYLLAKNAPEIH